MNAATRHTLRRRFPGQGSGFTLMEVMLALGISAIVLAAVGGVFYGAMHLRKSTADMLDRAAPLHQALRIMRRDLLGVMPPGIALAGNFRLLGGSGLSPNAGLQFSTTTGVIRENDPWADIQEVTWELREPETGGRTRAKDLVRSVSRNLLSTTAIEADEQRVLEGVESLEFSFLDSGNWRDTWDTSLSDTNLPSAIRVRVQMAPGENEDARGIEPVEMVIPVLTVSRTNTTSTADTTEAQQ